MSKLRAVITVIGKDKVGIIANVSTILTKRNVNILDISQTTMDDLFTMIMLTDVTDCNVDIKQLVDELDLLGKDMQLDIRLQREDIFDSMHRI